MCKNCIDSICQNRCVPPEPEAKTNSVEIDDSLKVTKVESDIKQIEVVFIA
ncbi:hypothetical protein [Vibrio cyclitrophicus]|uniref:hypothetical protein n=1 Tax=Vibrio cyclitrophicus TaxID=47951 RepID=UPI0032E47CFB